MKVTHKIAVLAGVLAIGVAPALAIADKPATVPNGPPATTPANEHSQSHKPDTLPGPSAPASTKAKAYGKNCQGFSKKHVAGQKGTPFSQCVTAMAKATHGTSPKAACKTLSKKHVKGEKGTPFSRCVVAAAKLKDSQTS
jgi:hypothetical protein